MATDNLPKVKAHVRNQRSDQQTAYNHLDIEPPVPISNQWRTLAFPPLAISIIDPLSPHLVVLRKRRL
jgi:hypothetical protein